MCFKSHSGGNSHKADEFESWGWQVRASKWVRDPSGRHELRLWNGSRWTGYVSNQGEIGEDPTDELPALVLTDDEEPAQSETTPSPQ